MFRRFIRHAISSQQGGRIFQLSSLGERGFRGGLRLQHAPVRPHEALRDAECSGDRHAGLCRRRDPPSPQAEATEGDSRESESRGSEARKTRGNRRRKGRYRRRHHNHPPLKDKKRV